MDAIEKRARELMAYEHRQDQRRAKGIRIGHKSVSRDDHLAVCAIVAALTPPEGYVLVPVEPTDAMKTAGSMWNTEMDESPTYEALNKIWRDMLAARPEVP